MFGGVKIFFYDRKTIEEEFGKSGLFEITEVTENYPFYLINAKRPEQKMLFSIKKYKTVVFIAVIALPFL
ncbi:hypothetical protein ACXZ1K_01065 [Pedobacter sp. PWIIR3]